MNRGLYDNIAMSVRVELIDFARKIVATAAPSVHDPALATETALKSSQDRLMRMIVAAFDNPSDSVQPAPDSLIARRDAFVVAGLQAGRLPAEAFYNAVAILDLEKTL